MSDKRKSVMAYAVKEPGRSGRIIVHTVACLARMAKEEALRCCTGAYSGETWHDLHRKGYRVVRVTITEKP